MKKRNGFVFMETIVVVSVLSITLLILFSSYSYILRKSKERDTFDTTEMIYKTYYVKSVIDDFKESTSSCSGTDFASTCYGIEYYINQNNTSSGKECRKMGTYNSYVCDLSNDSYSGYLVQVKQAFEVDKIYYVNPRELFNSKKKKDWLNQFDATTIDYINQLGSAVDRKVLIIKYKKTYGKSDGSYEVFHSSMEVTS